MSGERTLILKLNGGTDELSGRVRDSYVVSEDDYIDYLSQSDVSALLPDRARGAASAGATSCSSATSSTNGARASSCAGSGERSASPTDRGRSPPSPTGSPPSSGASSASTCCEAAADESLEELRRRLADEPVAEAAV